MKILQINKFHYRHGGSETVYFNTTDLLKEKGHEVIHFSIADKLNLPSLTSKYFVDMPNLSHAKKLEKIKNSVSFLYNTESAKNIEKLIRAEKPDLAHIHLLFNGISLSILPILKKYNIPIVMSIHDYRLICPSSQFIDGANKICEKCRNQKYYFCTINKCRGGGYLNNLMLTIEGYFKDLFYPLYKYIDKFIFVSDFARRKHIQFVSEYASNAVTLFNFTAKKKQIEPKSDGYFLYLGRLSREKGIPTLLQAAKELPDCKFVIAGDGPLRLEVEQYEGANIEYVGFKTGEELNQIIERASWIIVPSEWYENNPLAVIEPFSMGKPVIGANIGGIPELVKDGETGLLFESGNKADLISKIAQAKTYNIESYTQLSDATYEFANQHLSPEVHYTQLMKIYQSVIQK